MAYFPELPPGDSARLTEYVRNELTRLALELERQQPLLRLAQTNVAPDKPRAGDLRYADGTNWNPGSGAGIYWYDGASWTKL